MQLEPPKSYACECGKVFLRPDVLKQHKEKKTYCNAPQTFRPQNIKYQTKNMRFKKKVIRAVKAEIETNNDLNATTKTVATRQRMSVYHQKQGVPCF